MLPRSGCLIKSVSYLLSLTQGGMSWLLDSGQELGIWACFVFQTLRVFFKGVGVVQWQRIRNPLILQKSKYQSIFWRKLYPAHS